MYEEIESTDASRAYEQARGRSAISSGPRLSPPRLFAIAAPEATRTLPTLTAADVRISFSMVRGRASAYAEAARAAGAPHSMRLWREGYQRALLALTCEAAGIPIGTPCEKLTWEQHGAEYRVSATFRYSSSTTPTVH